MTEIDLTSRRPDPRWEEQMQRACEQRLAGCMEAFYHYEQDECVGQCDSPEHVDDPSCAPFDGCDTCVVREILDAAWPHLVEAAKKGLITDD